MGRPRRAGPYDELTPEQERELSFGIEALQASARGRPVEFASESEKRAAWERHRDRLMAEAREAPRYGEPWRPAAFWLFDVGEEWPPSREAERLEEMGELTDAERKALARK